MPLGQGDPSLEHLKLSYLRDVAPTDDGEVVLSFHQLRMSHQPMAAALDGNGATQYESGCEIFVNSLGIHHINQTICCSVVTTYGTMAATLDGNRATPYASGMELIWNRI